MENASKALIIAGGVLLGMMIIALVVFTYGQISSLGNQDYDKTAIAQQKDFNAQWEKYNGNIYGSDVLSIANMIEDYNLREAENKGYTPIATKIDFGNATLELMEDIQTRDAKDVITEKCSEMGISSGITLTGNLGEGREQEIFKCNRAIENAIKKIGNMTAGTPTRTVSYLSGLSSTKLREYGVDGSTHTILTDYTTLVQKQKIFKNTKFKAELEYDNLTGRVNKIIITKRG